MKKQKDELTKKEAKEMVLVRKGMVHTFFNMSWGLLGGDHSKESVFKDIDNSFVCKRTGEQAQAIGHGLVIVPRNPCTQSDLLFVETKPKKGKAGK
jgi:hypothetical protein